MEAKDIKRGQFALVVRADHRRLPCPVPMFVYSVNIMVSLRRINSDGSVGTWSESVMPFEVIACYDDLNTASLYAKRASRFYREKDEAIRALEGERDNGVIEIMLNGELEQKRIEK